MTDLEKSVSKALRLSDAAIVELLEEIQRNIDTARSELIRSGVSSIVVEEGGPLVNQAIITFCLMEMGDNEEYERYANAFRYQQDNLRKS